MRRTLVMRRDSLRILYYAKTLEYEKVIIYTYRYVLANDGKRRLQWTMWGYGHV